MPRAITAAVWQIQPAWVSSRATHPSWSRRPKSEPIAAAAARM